MKGDLSVTNISREKSPQTLGKESTHFTNELLISFPFQHPCTQGTGADVMRMMNVPNWLLLYSCNFKRSWSEENEKPLFWQRQSNIGMVIIKTNRFAFFSNIKS